MHDVVSAGAVTAHAVAINQGNSSFLASLHEQVRVSATALIGEEHYAAGCHVAVLGIEGGLVERSEIVGDGHHAVVQMQTHDAVAVVHGVGVRRGGIEGAVTGGHEKAASRTRASRIIGVGGDA